MKGGRNETIFENDTSLDQSCEMFRFVTLSCAEEMLELYTMYMNINIEHLGYLTVKKVLHISEMGLFISVIKGLCDNLCNPKR